MSRTIDQVLADVTARSDPQRQTVLSQIADLPNQQTADESALNAQKDQANQDILDSARRRGLGFSGIPVGEQAKYNATQFAPAVANLKTSYNNRRTTLEGALSDIGRNDYATANDIFNQDRNFEEQQRQFNESQRAAAAQQSSLAGLFAGNNTPAPIQPSVPNAPDPYAGIDKNNANNAIHSLLNSGNVGLIHDTINAITKSAANGNAYDKYKLELLKAATQSNNNAAYNPAYAKLLQSAASYKAPAPKPSVATQAKNFVTQPGSGNLSTGNLMNNLNNWFGWL